MAACGAPARAKSEAPPEPRWNCSGKLSTHAGGVGSGEGFLGARGRGGTGSRAPTRCYSGYTHWDRISYRRRGSLTEPNLHPYTGILERRRTGGKTAVRPRARAMGTRGQSGMRSRGVPIGGHTTRPSPARSEDQLGHPELDSGRMEHISMLAASRYWLVRDTPGAAIGRIKAGAASDAAGFFKGVARASLRPRLVSALPLSTRTRYSSLAWIDSAQPGWITGWKQG